MHDLAVVIVSSPSAPHWLTPCLTTAYQHAGRLDLQVVVADNLPGDGTSSLLSREFPDVEIMPCVNRGFAHGNNRALELVRARYVLFLNPDTEIVDGTFAQLVDWMDERPDVGLIGVRQVMPDGQLFPTIRRFPNAGRAIGEALGSERLPFRARSLGERELDLSVYEREAACDWTSGSFMLARHEALASAGLMDERYFLFSEETDLCLRIRKAGWEIMHVPTMTIVHHANKAGLDPRMEAQNAFSKALYARKHFTGLHRHTYLAAVWLRYGLRAVLGGRSMRAASRRALMTLSGRREPPFGRPPVCSVWPREQLGHQNRAWNEVGGSQVPVLRK